MWRFSAVGAESLRVRPSGGFVAASHSAGVRGCEFRSRVVSDILDQPLAGETNYDVLRTEVWRQSHPEAIRTYRQEERQSRANATSVKRAQQGR